MDDMDLEDVAERIGVTLLSARLYHNQATRRRREGTTLPRDLPEPDSVVGRSPHWKKDTIEEWIARRPGKGNRVSSVRPPV